jgi:hypothetical protein
MHPDEKKNIWLCAEYVYEGKSTPSALAGIMPQRAEILHMKAVAAGYINEYEHVLRAKPDVVYSQKQGRIVSSRGQLLYIGFEWFNTLNHHAFVTFRCTYKLEAGIPKYGLTILSVSDDAWLISLLGLSVEDTRIDINVDVCFGVVHTPAVRRGAKPVLWQKGELEELANG